VYTPRRLSQFKKDYKKQVRSGRSVDDIDEVIRLLLTGEPLAAKHRDHPLKGEWSDFRECHVRPDLVVIYQRQSSVLELVRLGDHAELFE